MFILFLVIVSLSFGCPHIIMNYLLEKEGKTYTPFVIEPFSHAKWDEVGYASKVRQAYDGRYFERGYFRPPILHVFLFALMTRGLGSIKNVSILGDFIFPPIIFLLIYCLLVKITQKKLVSVLGGAAVLYGHHLLFSFPPITVSKLQQTWSYLVNYGSGKVPLEFSRLESQFNFVIVTMAIYFFFKSLQTKKIGLGILAGLLLGTLFYCYFYYWTFFITGCVILLVWSLVKKDWISSKLILLTIVIGVLLSIPFWFCAFSFVKNPAYLEFLVRYALEYGRQPNIPWFYLAFALIFTVVYGKRDNTFYFLMSFFFAGIFLLNIHLVTGKTILKNHWNAMILQHWVVIMMIVFLVKIVQYPYQNFFIRNLAQLLKRIYILFCSLVITFFIFYGYYTNGRFAFKNYHGYSLSPELRSAFNWLNQNTANGSIVMSCSFRTSFLLPVYTHNGAFLSNGLEAISSNEEILERFLAAYKILGVPRNYVEAFTSRDATKKTGVPKGEAFGESYMFGFNGNYLSEKKAQEMIHNFSEYNPLIGLRKYPVDYVWVGLYDIEIKRDEIFKGIPMEAVYRNGSITIYKIMRPL